MLRHEFPDAADAASPIGRTNQSHYDLMIEDPQSSQLITWALQSWPLQADQSCRADQLANHRRAYLEYEGPISENRGIVRRVASGTAFVKPCSLSIWTVELQLDIGCFTLRIDANAHACKCTAVAHH